MTRRRQRTAWTAPRVLAALAAVILVAGCSRGSSSPDQGSDTDPNSEAHAIAAALLKDPRVSYARINYNNDFTVSAEANVDAHFRSDKDKDAVLDEILRRIWLSHLHPLRNLAVFMSRTGELLPSQPLIYYFGEKGSQAEFVAAYGPRPKT